MKVLKFLKLLVEPSLEEDSSSLLAFCSLLISSMRYQVSDNFHLKVKNEVICMTVAKKGYVIELSMYSKKMYFGFFFADIRFSLRHISSSLLFKKDNV